MWKPGSVTGGWLGSVIGALRWPNGVRGMRMRLDSATRGCVCVCVCVCGVGSFVAETEHIQVQLQELCQPISRMNSPSSTRFKSILTRIPVVFLAPDINGTAARINTPYNNSSNNNKQTDRHTFCTFNYVFVCSIGSIQRLPIVDANPFSVKLTDPVHPRLLLPSLCLRGPSMNKLRRPANGYRRSMFHLRTRFQVRARTDSRVSPREQTCTKKLDRSIDWPRNEIDNDM